MTEAGLRVLAIGMHPKAAQMKRHWESVIPFLVEAAWELKDLDRKEDL